MECTHYVHKQLIITAFAVGNVDLCIQIVRALQGCALQVQATNLRLLMMNVAKNQKLVENILMSTSDLHIDPLQLELCELKVE